LPNEFGAVGAVVVEAFVGPFPGDEHAAPGDAQVLGLVCLASASSRSDRVSGAFGLDSIEEPCRDCARKGWPLAGQCWLPVCSWWGSVPRRVPRWLMSSVGVTGIC
jgi:hypothetical protein